MGSLEGYQAATVTLFREAFEGRPEGQKYTWFVEKQEGIFDALDSVDADAASKKPSPDCASIAAHAYHILYALQLGNSRLDRPKPEGSWEDSWKKQSVDAAEWDALRSSIRDEYGIYVGWLEAGIDWDEEFAYLEHLCALPHMAFHLGALRQILKTI